MKQCITMKARDKHIKGFLNSNPISHSLQVDKDVRGKVVCAAGSAESRGEDGDIGHEVVGEHAVQTAANLGSRDVGVVEVGLFMRTCNQCTEANGVQPSSITVKNNNQNESNDSCSFCWSDIQCTPSTWPRRQSGTGGRHRAGSGSPCCGRPCGLWQGEVTCVK